MRTGATDWVKVNVPSGLATSDSVGVVAASTSTALPVACAWAEARASSSGNCGDEASGVDSAWAAVTAPERDSAPSAAASVAPNIRLRRVGLTVGFLWVSLGQDRSH